MFFCWDVSCDLNRLIDLDSCTHTQNCSIICLELARSTAKLASATNDDDLQKLNFLSVSCNTNLAVNIAQFSVCYCCTR